MVAEQGAARGHGPCPRTKCESARGTSRAVWFFIRKRVPTVTSIAESPHKFISLPVVQLTAKRTASPQPRALVSVANQPSFGVATHPLTRLAGVVAEPTPPLRTVGGAPLDTDRGEWKSFVAHLQRRGDSPGAGRDDPERGVVSPRNVSVRQMLAFLRTSTSEDPAPSAKSASLPSAACDAPSSAGGGTNEAIAAGPVDAPSEPIIVLQMESPPEMQEIASDDDESALDAELRQWKETYQSKEQPSPASASHEEDDEDDEPIQWFVTTPQYELAKYRAERVKQANAELRAEGPAAAREASARPRRIKFDEHEITRLYTPDPKKYEAVSGGDKVYLTKVDDGKSKPKRLPLALTPEQVTQRRTASQRGASRSPQNVPSNDGALRSALKRAAADEVFVVHAVQHPDPRDEPAHADFMADTTLWTDLGRDDEPAPVHVTQIEHAPRSESVPRNRALSDEVLAGLHFLQRLQEMQHRIDEGLRLNRMMTRRVGILV